MTLKLKTYAPTVAETNHKEKTVTFPIISVETMAESRVLSRVNTPQAIAPEGGSSSLTTTITALIKAMCRSPTVHSILVEDSKEKGRALRRATWEINSEIGGRQIVCNQWYCTCRGVDKYKDLTK